MTPTDPDAPAGSGAFGLDHDAESASVHVISAPFEATASYGLGSAHAPEAILRATRQVDLLDLSTGRPWTAGIHALDVDPRLVALDEEAARMVRASRSSGSDADRQRANDLCEEAHERIHLAVRDALEGDKIVALIGGDHSVSYGAIRAHAERHPGMGVLQFDAHADLREAYEGLTWSHASVMRNVLDRVEGVERLVQVGVRDLCEEEHEAIEASEGRVETLFDQSWAYQRLEGRNARLIMKETIDHLPSEVYVSFDIDGLEPALCPSTGTPVPGGLTWREASAWLDVLLESGRTVLGVDVNEVVPGPPEAVPAQRDSLDAIVGARMLYRLIGLAVASRL